MTLQAYKNAQTATEDPRATEYRLFWTGHRCVASQFRPPRRKALQSWSKPSTGIAACGARLPPTAWTTAMHLKTPGSPRQDHLAVSCRRCRNIPQRDPRKSPARSPSDRDQSHHCHAGPGRRVPADRQRFHVETSFNTALLPFSPIRRSAGSASISGCRAFSTSLQRLPASFLDAAAYQVKAPDTGKHTISGAAPAPISGTPARDGQNLKLKRINGSD